MKPLNKIAKNIKAATSLLSAVVILLSTQLANAQIQARTMQHQSILVPPNRPGLPPNLPRPRPTPPPPRQFFEYVKIDLVHQVQEPNLCAPTSASMMLSKVGLNFPPRQIKLATRQLPYHGPNTPFSDWTPMSMSNLMTGLRFLGINNWRVDFYPLQDFDHGLNNIKKSLKMGYPVMLLITFGGPVGHAVVVCGYDDKNQRLIINDPAQYKPGIITYTYSELKDFYWRNRLGFRGVVFMNQVSNSLVRTATTVSTSNSVNSQNMNLSY